ncbi:hypothetical protein GCM10017643_29470 [Ancylobacter dichloromethanicus]|uniref:Uncharacterized protein n=1 Tax=Ancylobacter dichloromethanicus TaxID=518825 RepID=A0A9W6JAJ1_9HYPH|nr:hypothetical protein GCM10017643_29470 [Ancylobacter dichloromethanicus]
MWAEPAVVRFIGGVPFTREAAWSRLLRHPGLWTFLGFGSFAVRKAFPPAQKESRRPGGASGFPFFTQKPAAGAGSGGLDQPTRRLTAEVLPERWSVCSSKDTFSPSRRPCRPER